MLGTGEYGAPFVSFVARGNVFGAQCHPEKSSTHGLALLRNFVGICSRASGARDPLSRDRHRRGRAVRLVQGDFDAETVYADSPLEAARAWVERRRAPSCTWSTSTARGSGRRRTSTTSRASSPSSACRSSTAAGCAASTPSPPRSRRAPTRAILGTAAFRDADFLDEAVARFGERIVVSIDTRGGFVSTAGWTQTTELAAVDVIEQMQDRGVWTFVFTNVDKDGLLGGPDLDEVRAIAAAVRGRLMYSGGIGRREDLAALAALRLPSLTGVIAGKALYERRFTVAEGIAALAP